MIILFLLPLSFYRYFGVGLMHIPCYGIFALIVRLKHLLLSRSFPDGYQSCRWGIRSGITLPWVGHVSRALVKHMQGQRQAGRTISYLKISNSFFLLWVSCCKGHCSLLHQVAMWKKLVYKWLILVGYNSSDVYFFVYTRGAIVLNMILTTNHWRFKLQLNYAIPCLTL